MASTDPLQNLFDQIGAFLKTALTDLTADEKTALKPVLTQFFTGLASNPDQIGIQLLVQQLIAGATAAQVQVKSALIPQIAALGQALVAAW
jgi:hypothetical protein